MNVAQALAKRGLNIDRCFIGISPGGVGQSLYSMLLAQVYKSSHAYFDPNMWYLDEELRKQVESFVGCIILTGQECPETNKKLREDLYKKTMSGDGVMGRKPYGVMTRMFELIGWKRIEVNRMMRFTGVTQSNFMSILRRSFVWRPKARFLDADYLKAHYPDAAKDGIFPKNPHLRVFMQSGPAARALISLQHGFEAKHTREQCEAMIEAWVVDGMDDDVTQKTMRMACGLPYTPKSVVKTDDQCIKQTGTPNVLQSIHCSPDDPLVEERQRLGNIVAHLMRKLSENDQDATTRKSVKYFRIKSTLGIDFESAWDDLIRGKFLVQSATRSGRKAASEMRMPSFYVNTQLQDIYPTQPDESARTFPELHDHRRLRAYLEGDPARTININTMLKFLYEASTKVVKRGKEKAELVESRKHFAELAIKIRDSEDCGKALLERLSAESQSQDTPASVTASPPSSETCKKGCHWGRSGITDSGVLLYSCSRHANASPSCASGSATTPSTNAGSHVSPIHRLGHLKLHVHFIASTGG